MTLLPSGIPVAGIDLSGEISATRFQRGEGYDELRARGFGEVSRAIPLYRSFTLVPYLFADVLGTRFDRTPAEDPSGRGRFVPGGGATLSADARKDIPGRGLVHSAGASAGFRYVPEGRPGRYPRHGPMVASGAPEPVRLHALAAASRGEGGRRAEGAPVVLHRVGLRSRRERAVGEPVRRSARPVRPDAAGPDRHGGGTSPDKNNASSDIYAKVGFNPIERWNFQGETLFDPVESTFSSGAVGGGMRKGRGSQVPRGVPGFPGPGGGRAGNVRLAPAALAPPPGAS